MHLSAVCKLISLLCLSTLLINVCDGTSGPQTTKKAVKPEKLNLSSNQKSEIPQMKPGSLITMNNESFPSASVDDEMKGTQANVSSAHQEDSNLKIEGRMWRGTKISLSEVPFFANVIKHGEIEGTAKRMCNAAFITSRVAVTAAHCFFDEQKRRIHDNQFFLRYNTDDLRTKRGSESEIEKIIIHRNFACEAVHSAYDIALVVLKVPFNGWTPYSLIKLPKQADKKRFINNGYPLDIVSTGPTFPRSSGQTILRKDIIPLYTEHCAGAFAEYLGMSPAFDPKRMLCNKEKDNLVSLKGTVHICTHRR